MLIRMLLVLVSFDMFIEKQIVLIIDWHTLLVFLSLMICG